MLKTQQWYQSLGLLSLILVIKSWKKSKTCCLTNGLGESMGGTRRVHVYLQPTRRVGSCNSASRVDRVQIFDFSCWKWIGNITLNCFGTWKLVLAGVMFLLIHLQQLVIKITKFNVILILESVHIHVLVHMKFRWS